MVLPGAAGKENTIEQGQMLPHQWGSRVAKSCRQDKHNIDMSVQPHPLLSAAAFPPSNHLHLSHILSHPFLTSSARDRRDCNRASISPDLVPTANHCRGLFPLLSSTCGYDMGKRWRGSWCWVAWSGQRCWALLLFPHAHPANLPFPQRGTSWKHMTRCDPMLYYPWAGERRVLSDFFCFKLCNW